MDKAITVIGYVQTFDPIITDKEADFLLWNDTAFPMCGIRMLTYQIRSAIRAKNGGIKRCELCGHKEPYHSASCWSFQNREYSERGIK